MKDISCQYRVWNKRVIPLLDEAVKKALSDETKAKADYGADYENLLQLRDAVRAARENAVDQVQCTWHHRAHVFHCRENRHAMFTEGAGSSSGEWYALSA